MRKTALTKAGALFMALSATAGALYLFPADAGAAAKVKSISVTPSNNLLGKSKTLYVGGPAKLKTTKLKVKVKPAKASAKVSFKSQKKKVAAVSAGGKVTAKKAGGTDITVTSKSNKKVKKKLHITVKKYETPVLSVKADKDKIYNGGSDRTAYIKAEVLGTVPARGVTFTSSDSALAEVSSSGMVTANSSGKTGTVKITVKSKKKTYENKTLTKTVTFQVESPSGGVSDVDKLTLDATAKTLVKTGTDAAPRFTIKATLPKQSASEKITWSSSDERVAAVGSDGAVTGLTTGTAVITAKAEGGDTASCTVTVKKSTVAVHDPSIFKDPKSGKYYTIGTQVAMAVSSDLQGWTAVTSGARLFKNGLDELQPLFDYTGEKSIGQVWAADLIYNTSMKKYCLYTCAAASGFKTVIGMFASDEVTGPYEYKGIIVCADFNKTTLDKTNIVSALGVSGADQVPGTYYDSSETGSSGSQYYKSNFPDAIDPAPFYGHDGNLYLTYGSFTCYGGIRVLKLNPDTGLRDKAYNYPMKEGESDPYFGKRITNKAGEGPYILKVPCKKSSTGFYYYLWTSSGILRGSGNYTMSMWRSENPDGPFVDVNGTDAVAGGGSVVCYNYKYSFMQYAHTSMGGNSALCDEDGNVYLVYHNKFSDNTPNPGLHMVKVHQMFINDDGWLVMAPFDYHGETIETSCNKEEVAGNYEFIMHRQATTTYVGDYNYNISVPLRLNADGTVSGHINGRWELSGSYITITSGDTKYKGVVLRQYEDDGGNGTISSLDNTLVFTALGNDRVAITGTKVTCTDKEAVDADSARIQIPARAEEDFALPQTGLGGSDITWVSSRTDALSAEGNTAKVKRLDAETVVTLSAEIKRGAQTAKKEFKVVIPAFEIVLPTTITSPGTLALPKSSVQGNAITWTASHPDIIHVETGKVTIPDTLVKVTLTAKYGDVTRNFEIRVGELKLKTVYEQAYKAGMSVAEAGWETHAALTGEIAVESGNAFARFTSTGSGPRSGLHSFQFEASALSPTYVIATDFAVTTATYSGSGQPTTQIALVSQSNRTNSAGNAIADSECLVDLQAVGMSSDTFTVNGNKDEKVTIPAGQWCHLEATVNQEDKQVFLMITDADGKEMYSGTFQINGDTKIKGLYILNGRGGTVTQFDNTSVKITG